MIDLAFNYNRAQCNLKSDKQPEFGSWWSLIRQGSQQYSFLKKSSTKLEYFIWKQWRSMSYEVAEYLIRNSYVLCGERKRVHRAVRGVPTGTNAAPEMTNIYLFYYELNFWMKQLPKWDELTKELKLFLLT
jgi:hypothetical protein